MNVGIVVEGPSDRAVYPVLMNRVRKGISNLQIRECGGKSKLKNGFLGFLKEFQRNPAWRIDISFVIRDSDCNPPQQVEEQLANVLRLSRFIPDFRVEFFATKCVLESWLLSDIEAIRMVGAPSHHEPEAAVQIPPVAPAQSGEDKDVFKKILSQFRLSPTPPVYGKIAALTNLNLISQRCNYFREFTRRVTELEPRHG